MCFCLVSQITHIIGRLFIRFFSFETNNKSNYWCHLLADQEILFHFISNVPEIDPSSLSYFTCKFPSISLFEVNTTCITDLPLLLIIKRKNNWIVYNYLGIIRKTLICIIFKATECKIIDPV